jgi:hypothetical protein
MDAQEREEAMTFDDFLKSRDTEQGSIAAHYYKIAWDVAVAAERERWRKLAQDVSMIADGDGVKIPTLLWAEEWERRMYGPKEK